MIQKSAQFMTNLDNELTWKKYYSGYRLLRGYQYSQKELDTTKSGTNCSIL